MGWIRLCWVCSTWGDQLQLCRRFNIILAIQLSPIAMHWWKDSVIFSGSLGFNLDPWQEVGEDELNSVLLRIGEICHHYMKKWWNRQMITSQYEVLLCPWMPIWKRAEAIWAPASDNLFAWQGRSWGQPHCHHLGFRHHLCQHIFVITIMICLSEEANSWSLTRRPPPLTGTQTSTLGNWWSININIFISIWHLPIAHNSPVTNCSFSATRWVQWMLNADNCTQVGWDNFLFVLFLILLIIFLMKGVVITIAHSLFGITSRPQSGFKFNTGCTLWWKATRSVFWRKVIWLRWALQRCSMDIFVIILTIVIWSLLSVFSINAFQIFLCWLFQW